jgi:hypothetical protein
MLEFQNRTIISIVQSQQKEEQQKQLKQLKEEGEEVVLKSKTKFKREKQDMKGT